MKRLYSGIVLVILVLTLVRCNEHEITPREYPRVNTLEVTNITSSGAFFEGEIIHVGNQEIIEYGFVWGINSNPTYQNSEKITLADEISTGSFNAEINTTLKEGAKYNVRAFVNSEDYLVYGVKVSFVSLGSNGPKITSFEPVNGTLGDTILITGANFSYLPKNNIVKFGQFVSDIITSSDSTILTVVPDSLSAIKSIMSVEIVGNRSQLDEPSFHLLPPIIDLLSSEYGKTGDTISIHGDNFGNFYHNVNITFDNKNSLLVNHNKNKLDVIVPGGININSKLKVTVGPGSSEVDFKYYNPELVDFEPKLVTWGDTIYVSVRNFPDDKNAIRAVLNGIEYEVLQPLDTMILFILPPDISARTISLGFNIVGIELNFTDDLILTTPGIISTNTDTVNFEDNIDFLVKNFHPTNNKITLVYRTIYGENKTDLEPFINSSSQVKFRFPILSQLRDSAPEDDIVKVEIDIGQTFTVSYNLVVRSPEIYSILPPEVSGSSDLITIAGDNFVNDSEVIYGDINLEIISLSENEIIAKVPSSFIENSLLSKFHSEEILITGDNLRSVKSSNLFIFNYQTAWDQREDGRLFSFGGDARYDFTVWGSSNYGYLMGGYRDSYPVKTKLYDFWRYEPAQDKWTRLPDIPKSEISSIKHVFHNANYAYVMNYGGANLVRYEYATESWVTLKPIPTNFYGIISDFEIDGKHFLITHNDSKIFLYDHLQDQWTFISDTPEPGQSINNHYSYNGNEIFNFNDVAYEFNPSLNNWTLLASKVSGKIIEHAGNYYKYGFNDYLYSLDPANGSQVQITEFPNGFGTFINYFFSIDGYLYYRDNDIVRYNTNF